MRALLDVNVLIALLDMQHLHHIRTTTWLTEHLHYGWASCPITQNGCIRIMSQPTYPNNQPASLIAARLAEAMDTDFHEFWPDDFNMVLPGNLHWDKLIGSRQVTDSYLLALAVHHKGRFITLDGGVSCAIVPKAQPKHLLVL
ncbi:hypothetical protein TI05_02790 [Achromatium sp. WMS3]|nr:hypothetical protein TI05_02790 [Achromatium sp. WMS3]